MKHRTLLILDRDIASCPLLMATGTPTHKPHSLTFSKPVSENFTAPLFYRVISTIHTLKGAYFPQKYMFLPNIRENQ
jgi:hypothetical protein